MFLTFLFSLSLAKKRICVCNNECSLFCPTDSYVATKSESNFKDFLSKHIQDENEIEIDFYSKDNEFSFEIDQTIFGNKNVILKTLSDSRPVQINIQEKFQSFNKIIHIEPDYQVNLPDLIPIKSSIYNKAKMNILDDPEPTPVPISVSIESPEVKKSGDFRCETTYQCTNPLNDNAYRCGQRCWANNNNQFDTEFTFKGVKYQIYGTKTGTFGPFDVVLDGNVVQTINPRDSTRQAYVLLYESDEIEYGEHTLKTVSKGNQYELYKFAFWPTLKGKRLNATDMLSNGTWQTESDLIGGLQQFSQVSGSTKYYLTGWKKVWIYGLVDPNHGVMHVEYGDEKVDVDTRKSPRSYPILLFESNLYSYGDRTVYIGARGISLISCIYYVYDPPPATPAPAPSRTPIPDSDLNFIDKQFEGSYFGNQIIIDSSSQVQQISGCTFTNINSPDKIYYIKICKEISFFQNTFQHSSMSEPNTVPSPLWLNYDGRFTMSRCKFTNCQHRTDRHSINDGNILNVNSDNILELTIENCEFVNCGQHTDMAILGIINSQSTIKFTKCIFTFDDGITASMPLYTHSTNVAFEECQFTKTGTIKLDCESNSAFSFKNNTINSMSQGIIYLSNTQAEPILVGNSFSDCDVHSGINSFIYINHIVTQINLVENDFRRVSSTGGNQFGGGIGIWIQNRNNVECAVNFASCKFIECKNQQTGTMYVNGGAIQFGYSTSTAPNALTFNNCQFIRNECLSGKGSALSLSTNKNLVIDHCKFQENVGQQGGAIYIWGKCVIAPDLTENSPESQLDSISITNCEFSGNKGGDVSAICIEEENIKFVTVSISSTTFEDNADANTRMLIQASCQNIEFNQNTVTFSSNTGAALSANIRGNSQLSASGFTNCKCQLDSSIQIVGTENSRNTITNCNFTNCKANKYSLSISSCQNYIEDSTFVFDNTADACSGLHIHSPNSLSISYCEFQKNNNIQTDAGACLYIHRESGSASITINNVVFDSCTGNEFSTINVDVSDLTNPELTVNQLVIRNIPSTSSNIYKFHANKNIVFTNCNFENCQSSNVRGGGTGAYLHPLNSISFTQCTWTKNYCSENGGALQHGDLDLFNQNSLSFTQCHFIENKSPKFGGALAIQTKAGVTIFECEFLNNVAGYSQSSSLLEDDQKYGGALYINPNFQNTPTNLPKYTITDSVFKGNQASDGHAIYINTGKNNAEVDFAHNAFTDNGETGYSIITDYTIDVSDSTFNFTDSNQPHSNPIEFVNTPARYEDMNFSQDITLAESNEEGYFRNCTFSGFPESIIQSLKYVINVNCAKFTFDNCTIRFDHNSEAIGGIGIYCKGTIDIHNSFFIRCKTKADGQSAGIYYVPTTGSTESLTINDNVFRDLAGDSSRCFRIKVDADKLTCTGNAVEELNVGQGFGTFDFTSGRQFTFTNWKFISNTGSSDNNGGSGIEVLNVGTVKYDGCIWQDNFAQYSSGSSNSGHGGALQFGSSYAIEFHGCQFIGNKADREGGALALNPSNTVTIESCQFSENKILSTADAQYNKGGAIFVNPTSSSRVIFTSLTLTENEATYGAAIAVQGNSQYTISILTIRNNGNSQHSLSAFYSTATNLNIALCDFIADKEEKRGNRAIDIDNIQNNIQLELLTITGFKLNKVNQHGGAIKFSGTRSSNSELLSSSCDITSCVIKNCQTTTSGSFNGYGGGAYADGIDSLLITNTTFDNCRSSGDGSIMYVTNSVGSLRIDLQNRVSLTKFKNTDDSGHYMIVCGATLFEWSNMRLLKEDNNKAKGIRFIGGDDVEFDGLYIEGLTGVVELEQNVRRATIQGCTFSDCPSNNDFVVKIGNQQCTFQDNTIIFTEAQSPKGRALKISSNGNINVNNNKFINCFSSAHNQPTIVFDPPEATNADTVRFNYNVIEGLSGFKLSLMSIKAKNQNFDMAHNIISKCTNANKNDNGYVFEVTDFPQEFTFTNITFRDIKSGATYGGSIGLWITTKGRNYENAKLTFEKCHFINNEHIGTTGGGAFQMGWNASNAKFETVFDQCEFTDNKAAGNGGALALFCLDNKPTSIRNCVFNNNKALGTVRAQHLDLEAGYGGAIYIDLSHMASCEIDNCTFQSNSANVPINDYKHGYGNAIYIINSFAESTNNVEISKCRFDEDINPSAASNCLIYSSIPVFSISHSTITFSSINSKSLAFKFVGANRQNTLLNVSMTHCSAASGVNANAIEISNEIQSVDIQGCTFKNCGKNFNNRAFGDCVYTIYDEAKTTVINNCTFDSDLGGPTGPAIFINTYGTHSITNCVITNPVCRKGDKAGCVKYKPSRGTPDDEEFEFTTTTISGADGDDHVAFSMKVQTTEHFKFNDVTVKNCLGGSCLIGFEFSNQVTGFTFERIHFLNNKCNASYGGGCSIWFNCDQLPGKIPLVFRECTFKENDADEWTPDIANHRALGGALQLADNPQSRKLIFSLIGCTFERNHADYKGGALHLTIENSYLIQNCTFTGNDAPDGGAIYLNVDKDDQLSSENITITNCHFLDNVGNGSAIFCSSDSGNVTNSPHIYITGKCQFEISAKSNLTFIQSQSTNLYVNDVSFAMENLEKSCRAIHLKSGSNAEIYDTHFTYCNMETGLGNAIYIESIPRAGSKSAYIHDCIFENCGTFGWPVYSLANSLVFQYNAIRYTSNAQNQGGGGLYAIDGQITFNRFENTYKYANLDGNPLTIYSSWTSIIVNDNVFNNCNGEDIRVFNISLDKTPSESFRNNTVKNCPEVSALLGSIEIRNPDSNSQFILDSWHWESNRVVDDTEKTSNIGGGAGFGIYCTIPVTISLENCVFESNHNSNKGGAFQFGLLIQTRGNIYNFNHCTFRGNQAVKGGALAVESTATWQLDDCTFENNQAQDGGAIYVNTCPNDTPFAGSNTLITNCHFNNNQASSNKGSFIYATHSTNGLSNYAPITISNSNEISNKGEKGYMVYNEYQNLVLEGSQFSFTGAGEKDFGGVWTGPQGISYLNDCKFNGVAFATKSESNSGNAARLSEGASLNAQSSVFTDCYSNANSNYVIFGDAAAMKMTIYDSVFNFTNTEHSACAICFTNYGTLDVKGCNFTKCWFNGANNFGAAIRYGVARATEPNYILDNCNVKVRECIFENCNNNFNQNTGGRVIHGYGAQRSEFSDNIFKDTVDGGYIFTWGHEAKVRSQFSLTRCTFQNNHANCKDGGGGSGIWISQTAGVTFEGCRFINNVLTTTDSTCGGGGALGFGYSSSLTQQSITFHLCYFDHNQVPTGKDGAGLYIRCNNDGYPVLVDNCTFSNQACRRGSGICIDRENQGGVTINNCYFIDLLGIQDGGADGNAIFINENAEKVVISACTFTDCHFNTGHSTIYSQGKELEFTDNIITFHNNAQSSRGLMIQEPTRIYIEGSTFENCFYNSHGSAIAYNPSVKTGSDASVTILKTTVDNCGPIREPQSTDASAIYLGINPNFYLRFSQVTLQNCHAYPNRYLIIIKPPTGKLIDEFTFDNCYFFNTSTDFTANYAGGIGLLHNSIKNLIFQSCEFNGLRSTTYGGAIAFVSTSTRETSSSESITFTTCIFVDNSATGNNAKGGSLYFNSNYLISIEGCQFHNQTINGYGGAICMDSISSLSITDCTFKSTQESSGHGNAIYLSLNLGTPTIFGNTFEDCGVTGSVIESEAREFEFNQNTIRFTTPGQGARGLHFPKQCSIRIIGSTISNCFQAGNGGGLFFEGNLEESQPESIYLEGTTFEGNEARSGSAVYLNLRSLPNISGCTIRNHLSGKLTFCIIYQVILPDEVSVDGCTFEGNYFDGDVDGGGSGIWITSAQQISQPSPISFNSCTFRNNHAAQVGGAFAYGESPLTQNISITFRGCTFADNIADGERGGAFWLNTQTQCNIDNCDFTGGSLSGQKSGIAVYVHERGRVSITDSRFVDCGTEGLGSAVVFNGAQIVMNDNIFQYNQENNGSRGVYITSGSHIELERNEFIKCHSTGNGGGLYLLVTNLNEERDDIPLFKDLIFDNNTANNGCAAIFDTSIKPDIQSCTVKNHQSGKYVFSIFFNVLQYEYSTFVSNVFENNAFNAVQNSEDGGGAGLWIANKKEIAQERSLQLTLTECQFNDNVSPYAGGGFAIGRSATVQATYLSLERCIFRSNSAESKGGALWLATRSDITVTECEFRNNKALSTAGSIVIESTAPTCTISKCSFYRDNADTKANSIYVNCDTTETFLIENTFSDCGHSSTSDDVIAVNCNVFEFYQNTVSFTNLLNSCRGLMIENPGQHMIINNTFSKCNISSGNKLGGGIYYSCPDSSLNVDSDLEDLSIERCKFDYCIAESGSALYINPKSLPQLTNNTVQNSRFGQYTFTFILKKGTLTDFVLDRWTFYNNRASAPGLSANDNRKFDGGGSGILITNPQSAYSVPFNLTFRDCNWTLNTSPQSGGGALSYGFSESSRNVNLIFDGCTFYRNNCKKEIAGALCLAAEAETTLLIRNCHFTSNKALSNTSYGGAIYLDSTYKGRVDIIDSEFTKNSAIDANAFYIPNSVIAFSIEKCSIISNGNTNSQIVNYCNELNIIDSELGFGSYTLTSRALCCLAKCRLTIQRCTIPNCKINGKIYKIPSLYNGGYKTAGAAILYDDQLKRDMEEQIIIEETIFSNCIADNGAALLMLPSTPIIFNRNTIEDCRGGQFIFSLFAQQRVEEFKLDDCIFRHNRFTRTENNGGGSGLWLSNSGRGDEAVLTFNSCHWIDNTAPHGGAIEYGSGSLNGVELHFNNCEFFENTATTGQGGALILHTNKPISIKECTFQSNKATGSSQNRGGAIVIDSPSPSIDIVGCTFNSESAINANAIFVTSTTNNVNITDCIFNDCGYGQQNGDNNAILLSSKAFTIDGCTFKYESQFKYGRAICISGKSIGVIRDTKFHKNRLPGDWGAAIYKKQDTASTNEESLLIEGCLFDGCQGSNGQAIYVFMCTPLQFRNNLVWNHNSGKFTFVVVYLNKVNETIIEDSYFEHNTFNVDGLSGGGSGMWIQCSSAPIDVTFSGCTWRNNSVSGNGGAFAAGSVKKSLANLNFKFEDSIFINNTATSNGGAIYINYHTSNIEITRCFFDGNRARGGYGGAICIEDENNKGDVSITDSSFARNSAIEGGALRIKGPESLILNSNTFSENTVSRGAVNIYLQIAQDCTQDQIISNCKFDYVKYAGQYQIYIHPKSETVPEISVIFIGNCFTHSGDSTGTAHINSDFKGIVQLKEGNCFDLPKELSVRHVAEGNLQVSEGLFDCHTCQVPSIPTSPPTNMPSATPEATPLPTPTPEATSFGYTPTETSLVTSQPSVPPTSDVSSSSSSSSSQQPTTSTSSETSVPISAVSSSESGENENTSSSNKNQSKKIVMIAGIAVAIVVVVCVIVILIWLFVCRNRTSVQQEERSRNTEMNEETVSGITGVEENNQADDPIWAGTSSTQDNLLFEGNENNEEADDGMNNDFEESWGVM